MIPKLSTTTPATVGRTCASRLSSWRGGTPGSPSAGHVLREEPRPRPEPGAPRGPDPGAHRLDQPEIRQVAHRDLLDLPVQPRPLVALHGAARVIEQRVDG